MKYLSTQPPPVCVRVRTHAMSTAERMKREREKRNGLTTSYGCFPNQKGHRWSTDVESEKGRLVSQSARTNGKKSERKAVRRNGTSRINTKRFLKSGSGLTHVNFFIGIYYTLRWIKCVLEREREREWDSAHGAKSSGNENNNFVLDWNGRLLFRLADFVHMQSWN